MDTGSGKIIFSQFILSNDMIKSIKFIISAFPGGSGFDQLVRINVYAMRQGQCGNRFLSGRLQKKINNVLPGSDMVKAQGFGTGLLKNAAGPLPVCWPNVDLHNGQMAEK